MRIFGLCSFYQESPTWLASFVAAASRLCDYLIFVDGAYVLYDREGASSGVESHDAIARACHAAGIGFTLHVPSTAWVGNEVEKRAYMFRLAETLSTEDDFYAVLDVDMPITRVDRELVRSDLERGEFDVYEGSLVERWDWNTGPDGALIVPGDNPGTPAVSATWHRFLFRARRGLTVSGAHYLYIYPDEGSEVGFRTLWGPGTTYEIEPAGRLEVDIEHWSKFRPQDRRQAAIDYYTRRDNARIERTTRNYVRTVEGGLEEI